MASARTPAKEITLPQIAEAMQWSRRTALRRIHDSDVVRHQRGNGTKRKHIVLTIPEIQASNLGWILDAIDWEKIVIERAKQTGDTENDDDEFDDEPRPVALRRKDGVYR